MKNIFIIITVSLISYFSRGQSCTAMFPVELGVKFQHSGYKADGTLEALVDETIMNVTSDYGRIIATVDLSMSDVANSMMYPLSASVECNGDITYMDPTQFIPIAMLDTFVNEYDGRIEKSPMELPYNLSIGDDLSNYYFEVFATVSGMAINLSSQTYGRKVIAKETVETLAGTFDCYVIEFTTHLRLEPNFMPATTTTGKHWVAKGVGTVKMELYKDGNLDHYTMLTGFQR